MRTFNEVKELVVERVVNLPGIDNASCRGEIRAVTAQQAIKIIHEDMTAMHAEVQELRRLVEELRGAK